MSRTPRAESYRAVLALPYAAPTFAGALVGRLAYGLLPLSVLFTVQHATGSFATAGAVVAAFGLTSLLLPLKSRLVDRHGQPRVLLPLAMLCGGTLSAIALLADSGRGSAAAFVGLGTLAGLAAPPLGPAMRSTWRLITDGTGLKPRAYGLDSVCEESLYLVGPVLVGVILGVASGAVALLVTSSLLVVGTAVMVAAPPARAIRLAAPTRAGWFDVGPLRAPGFAPVAVTVLAAAIGLSMAYTSIAARAQHHGAPEAAGYIEAAIALGSVVGGLWWGRRRHRRRRSAHLAGLTAFLAVGIGLASAAESLLVLGAVLAVAGLAVAPLFVVAYLASDELAPAEQRTEASTWVNTANNIGSAAGASAAGVLVERAGVAAGFGAGALALVATSALIVLARGRIDRPTRSTGPIPVAGGAAQSRT
ncbi:MAG: MFS transporter [Nocardioidaceae bacterium]